ncbi:proteasome accessory factor PafA2 family protein [Kocuria rhizophila]|nr:proteasome accessory factor PafA2 family protein [Kocuria rhizophila]
MVNTRDKPRAPDDSRYRRLHVIVGDANLSTRPRC